MMASFPGILTTPLMSLLFPTSILLTRSGLKRWSIGGATGDTGESCFSDAAIAAAALGGHDEDEILEDPPTLADFLSGFRKLF